MNQPHHTVPAQSTTKHSITALAESIRHHRHLYGLGKPEISDMDYDAIEEKLRRLDPNHALLSEVGYPNGGKVYHPIPVLSLEKTRTFKRVKFWAQKLPKWLHQDQQPFFPPQATITCLYKLDGAFIALVYRNGHFIRAKTRGDGSHGEDVTQTLKHTPHLPQTLSLPQSIAKQPNTLIEIRGELCCPLESFTALQKEMKGRKLELPSTRRNIVAGVLLRKDHTDLARYLCFYAFDVVHQTLGEDHLFASEQDKLTYLNHNGFTVAPHQHLPTKNQLTSPLAQTFHFLSGVEWEISYRQGKLQWLRGRQSHKKHTVKIPSLSLPSSQTTLAGIPLQLLAKEGDFSVSGNISCSKDQQTHLKELLLQAGIEANTFDNAIEQLLTNTANRQQISPVEQPIWQILEFSGYDVEDDRKKNAFIGDLPKHAWLKEQGFILSQDYQDFAHYLEHTQTYAKDQQRHLDIDGIVLSYNNTATHPKAGQTAHHPNFRLSYKWQGSEVKSTIEKIVWEVSKKGTITPIALITPVTIGGATIKRVTLHNKDSFLKLAPRKGDTVYVIRAGEIIPRINRIIHNPDNHNEASALLPHTCPACSAPLDNSLSDTWVICSNKENCPPQIIGKIDHWCKSVDIEDLSKKRLKLLLDHEIIHNIPDLYSLTAGLQKATEEMAKAIENVGRQTTEEMAKAIENVRRQTTEGMAKAVENTRRTTEEMIKSIDAIPGFGKKAIENMMNSIERSKTPSLEKFLMGLGISGLQKASIKVLLQHHSSLEEIRRLQSEEIARIKGFAQKSADIIANELQQKEALIDALLAQGVKPIPPQKRA